MEDFALGIYLFAIYFLFLCWLFQKPAASEKAVACDQETKPQVTKEVLEKVEVNELSVEQKKEDAPNNLPSLDDLFCGIEIKKLKLRQARKVAKALDIRQKVNRKDQPLSWLQAQIQKRLEEEPYKVARIISEVLQAA